MKLEAQETTIVFPIRGPQMLLGMKKEHFGEGKWNGFRGKRMRHDKTIEAAAVRELEEESRLVASPEDLELVARIKFFEGDELLYDCSVFFLRRWHGTERETKEMRPQWFSLDALPYEAMWAADRQWIPVVLEGWKINAMIRFKFGMKELESFEYVELAA